MWPKFTISCILTDAVGENYVDHNPQKPGSHIRQKHLDDGDKHEHRQKINRLSPQMLQKPILNFLAKPTKITSVVPSSSSTSAAIKPYAPSKHLSQKWKRGTGDKDIDKEGHKKSWLLIVLNFLWKLILFF